MILMEEYFLTLLVAFIVGGVRRVLIWCGYLEFNFSFRNLTNCHIQETNAQVDVERIDLKFIVEVFDIIFFTRNFKS